MTPNTYLYFDYYQAKDTDSEPLAIGGYLPMERVYSYEPMPSALSPEEQVHYRCAGEPLDGIYPDHGTGTVHGIAAYGCAL